MSEWKPRYSGPNRSGICVCGHRWDSHHLSVVQNQEYYAATGEEYVPEECEFYGCNELGGMMPGKDGRWFAHCSRYVDEKA